MVYFWCTVGSLVSGPVVRVRTAGRVRWNVIAELTADRKQKERKKTHPSRASAPHLLGVANI